ncbi:MAG: autotransporter-associated beta strand repeat-containing protein [Opitutales bacterium]
MALPSRKRYPLLCLALLVLGGPVPLSAEGLLQADSVSLPATADGQTSFVSVTFDEAFTSIPVVVLTPNRDNPDPAALRIRNVTNEGFEVVMVEPSSENGEGPAMNNISFVAAEEGLYQTDSGELLEVRHHLTNSASAKGGSDTWDTISLRQAFGATPSVTGMVQTDNNETGAPPGDPSDPWVTTHNRNLGTSSFETSLGRAETGAGNLSVDERMGYILFEESFGSFTDDSASTVYWDAFNSANTVDGSPTTINYNQTNFGAPPLVQATIGSYDGGDGGWARFSNNTASSVDLNIDEDRVQDPERNHTTEIVSLLAFSGGFTETLGRSTVIEWVGLAGMGPNGDDFSDSANWSGWDGTDGNLSYGDGLLFDNTGSGRTDADVDVTYSTPLGQIRFEESTAYTITDGGGSLVFASGGSIVNNSTVLQTIEAPLSSSGPFMGIRAAGADLDFSATSTLDLSADGGASLIAGGAQDITHAGVISGTDAGITKWGAGDLTLTGNNTFTGDVRIRAGRVIGDGDSLPADIINEASLVFDEAGSSTYGGVLSGDGDVFKQGAGTLTLASANTYTGTTTVTGGGLAIDADDRLGAVPGSATPGHLTLDGGTLQATGTFALAANRGLTAGAGGAEVSVDSGEQLTYAGILAGSGDLEKTGAGTLLLDGGNANTLSGATTVTAGTLALGQTAGTDALAGAVSLDGGVLQLNADDQIANTADLTFNGGEFSLNGFSEGGIASLGVDQMTVSSTSTLRFAGVSVFRIQDLSFAGGGIGLNVEDWVGDPINGGVTGIDNRFLVATDITGAGFLSDILFPGWNNASATVLDLGGGIFEIVPDAVIYQWDQDVSGDWNIDANWSEPGIPDATGALAQLVDITADRTVTLTANRTVGALDITEDTNSYTVTGNTLIMQRNNSGAGTARLGVTGNGVHTIASDLQLENDLKLLHQGTGDLTLSGVIADGSKGDALVKDGSGTVVLSGTNTYTGSTTIEGGALQITADAGLGAAPGTATPGHLALVGGGLIAEGTFTLSANRGIDLGLAGGFIDVTAGESLTYGGVMDGGIGAFEKRGDGTLILSGTNTYAGATAITGGTLQVSADANLGAAPGTATPDHLVFDGGTLNTTSTVTLDANRGVRLDTGGGTFDTDGATTLTVDGIIAGNGSLTKQGAGTLVLAATNTFTGSTSVTGGTLQADADAKFGAAPGSPTASALTLDGGTLEATATFSLDANRGITLGAGNGTVAVDATETLTVGGTVAGSGALTKTGDGTLVLDGTGSYAGGTTLSAGGLDLGNNTSLGSGDLVVSGTSTTLSSQNGVTSVANNLVLNQSLDMDLGDDATFSGAITGTGGLTRLDDRTLILTGTNTYSGATDLGTGNLQIGDGGATGTLGSGTVSGDGASALRINRTGTVDQGGTIDVGTFAVDSSTFVADQDITAQGAFEMAAGTSLQVDSDLTLDLTDTGGASVNVDADASIDVAANQTLTINLSNPTSPPTTAETVYHDFNDNSGTIAADDSGNGYDGAALGSLPTFATGTLIEGTSSARFNGSQGISFANGNQLISNDGESVLSVATWVRLDSITSGVNQVFEEGGGTNGVQIWFDDNTLNAQIKNNGGSDFASVTANNAIQANEWAHVALVYDNSEISLYLDGALAGTDTFVPTLNNHGSDGGIGAVNGGPFVSGNLTGYLDEFYYWNDYALTASDVASFGNFRSAWLGDLNLADGSTVTLNHTATAAFFDSVTTTGDATINGSARLDATTFDTASGTTLTVSNEITSDNDLTKNGAGTLDLTGTSTFTGDVVLNDGTLQVSGALYDGVDGGNLTLNGGTLLLDSTTAANNALTAPDVTLAGGRLQLGAGADGANLNLGTLTLTADGIVDFGAADAILNFEDLALNGNTLHVYNWDGIWKDGGGDDQLIFGTDLTSILPTDQILFYRGAGGTPIPRGIAIQVPGGEVVPVPEPSTYAVGGLIGLTCLVSWWKRRRRAQAASEECF